jgi:hypothetical protein
MQVGGHNLSISARKNVQSQYIVFIYCETVSNYDVKSYKMSIFVFHKVFDLNGKVRCILFENARLLPKSDWNGRK